MNFPSAQDLREVIKRGDGVQDVQWKVGLEGKVVGFLGMALLVIFCCVADEKNSAFIPSGEYMSEDVIDPAKEKLEQAGYRVEVSKDSRGPCMKIFWDE